MATGFHVPLWHQKVGCWPPTNRLYISSIGLARTMVHFENQTDSQHYLAAYVSTLPLSSGKYRFFPLVLSSHFWEEISVFFLFSKTNFLKIFTIKSICLLQENLYMFEDFNIYLDLPNLNTRSFMDVLQTYALHQHVSVPTHVYGHWLDLFITRSTCINIKTIFPTDGLSDHQCVTIDLWLQVGSRSRKNIITFRPINKINIKTLHDDLANSDLLIKPKSTLCELVNQYNETLSKLLDKHAPKQTKSVQVRPQSPWMSNEIIIAKCRLRYLERIWRRSHSPID